MSNDDIKTVTIDYLDGTPSTVHSCSHVDMEGEMVILVNTEEKELRMIHVSRIKELLQTIPEASNITKLH